MPLVVDGTSGVTFNDSSLQGAAASPFGLKNRIINGDMVIDQRNNGGNVTGNGAYVTDRWQVASDTTTFTCARSTQAPVGFVNSFSYTNGTGASPTAAQQNQVRQAIEGFNISDFGLGTANAITFTLSFWVRSSITGTFAGSFFNDSYNRSYVFTYAITSANTWERKTITVAGDTSGTWLTNNSAGLRVVFDLGSGSNYNTTANTWSAGEFRRTSGSVNFVATTGATWFLTGVQLERNTTATPFEWIPYGTELALCQRYCVVLGGDASEFNGYAFATNNSVISIPFPTTVRTPPSGITTSGQWIGYNASNASFNTTLTFNVSGFTQCSVLAPFTATAGTPSRISANNVARIIFNGMEL